MDAVVAPRRLGGHPALDFINTVDPDWAEPEYLSDYGRLVDWCEAGGVLGEDQAQALRRRARADSAMAERWLAEALEAREAARALLAARVAGRAAASRHLAAFNARLKALGEPGELAPLGLGYVRARRAGDPLAEPVRRVVELVADLLASPDLGQVGRCAGETCGWFFIDRSPTKRRRWCSMEVCGNRAKARRHYRTRREADPTS
jgi:predicted RNA-binding Zn ribbon-like protein